LEGQYTYCCLFSLENRYTVPPIPYASQLTPNCFLFRFFSHLVARCKGIFNNKREIFFIMKAKGFTLNNFDFIINSLQPTGMNGISAMIDNSIGMSCKHFCKTDESRNTAFSSHGTPPLERFFARFGIAVMPEFFQAVLQNISRGNRLIDLKERFQSRFFFLTEIALVHQKDVLTSLYNFFAFPSGFLVFVIAHPVNDAAKGTDHMKLVKDDGGVRSKPLIADYVLTYKNQKLAVVEAKSDDLSVGEGVAQAKNYAGKLNVPFAYSSNGNEIYEMNMKTGEEKGVASFPTPDELWRRIFAEQNNWLDAFNAIPFEDIGGTKPLRFYQEIAVNKALKASADGRERILLTLATGTGKTFIAFQIAWKLFYSRWNLQNKSNPELAEGRRPRILFLADRNILADQAFNAFSAFPEDALVRINPAEIRNNGRVPTNGSIFFTIFQTFMSGPDNLPYFGQYPEDYFDFIVIDECHRGGANDESNWREIMEYFSPAVQLGLTATPKRTHNIDTYNYFGEPVYIH